MAASLDRAAALAAAVERFSDVHNRRDWDAMRDVLVDDYAFVDHRATGFGSGSTLEAYLSPLKTAIELVPDRRTSVFEPVAEAPGYVMHMTATGTDEFGSRIDWDFFAVFDMRDGKLSRLEVFDVADLDDALRRADELSRGG